MTVSILRNGLALLLLASTGCSSGSGAGSSSGGGSSSGESSSSGGNGGNTPITLPGGGQVPVLSCGSETIDDAVGLWEVVASNTTDVTGIGSIVVKQNQLLVESNGKLFTLQSLSSSTVSWTGERGTGTEIAVAKRTPSDFDMGVLPLRVGGISSFGETGDRRLQLTVDDGEIVVEASRARLPAEFGYDFSGTARATRTERRLSAFGRLGGVWQIVGVDGSDAMTVVIEGATFTVIVTGNAKRFPKKDSWLTLRVCEDGAVGKTSLGVDIAAVRR